MLVRFGFGFETARSIDDAARRQIEIGPTMIAYSLIGTM